MKPKCCRDKRAIEETRQTIELLKVVAEENRLRILCILKRGEHCVCQIIDYLDLSQSLVSHHLKCLKDAGIIGDSKRGLWVYYSLTKKGEKVVGLLSEIKQMSKSENKQ